MEELRRSKKESAFFFESEYNIIIVQANSLLSMITRKFEANYLRLVRIRSEGKIDDY